MVKRKDKLTYLNLSYRLKIAIIFLKSKFNYKLALCFYIQE